MRTWQADVWRQQNQQTVQEKIDGTRRLSAKRVPARSKYEIVNHEKTPFFHAESRRFAQEVLPQVMATPRLSGDARKR